MEKGDNLNRIVALEAIRRISCSICSEWQLFSDWKEVSQPVSCLDPGSAATMSGHVTSRFCECPALLASK